MIPATATIPNQCLTCGKPLRGRPDKKFCDYGCKNEYNNRLQRQERKEMNRIDLILKHNRRMLRQCLGAKTRRVVPKTELLQLGIRFEFHTHFYENARGERYAFSYDYGYLELKEDRCLVIKTMIPKCEIAIFGREI